MKKHIKHLNTVASLIFLFLITGAASAQNSTTRDRIIAVQSGTIILENGKANVELNQQVQSALNDAQGSSSYVVVFTPYEGAGSISLLEKSNNKFSVASSNVAGAKADYVVFLKQTIQRSSLSDNAAVIAK